MTITISHYLMSSEIDIIEYVNSDSKAAVYKPTGKNENFSSRVKIFRKIFKRFPREF